MKTIRLPGRWVSVAGLALLLWGAVAAGSGVRTLMWDDLIPGDWDLIKRMEALREKAGGELVDGSPEADALLQEFVTAGRDAPVVGALDGQTVKIPGYMVPLDFEEQAVAEFLLVPYFGACIHVPPPPANQIVYVKSSDAYRLEGMFEAVWVTGTMKTRAHLNDLGDAGYTLEASAIEPYE